MIEIGQTLPDATCKALDGTEFRDVRLEEYRGRWLFLYFWPLDFTFVCPTEIKAFSDAVPRFQERDCAVLGGSCDSVYSHLGWTLAKRELADLRHPMLSDYTKSLSASLGILDHESGACRRASFLVDPQGVVRFVYVTDLAVPRSPDEVLRVLEALQSTDATPFDFVTGAPA